MNETKIQLSAAEEELMCNAEVILTKNVILLKIKTLFEELQEEMTKTSFKWIEQSTTNIFAIGPKISRGENYEGLPYIILDYPRFFQTDNIFAVRTMFWWGNFFSTTLHLSGAQKDSYRQKIEQANKMLSDENFYIGVNSNPWIHNFNQSNYVTIGKEQNRFRTQIAETGHLKLASKIPLINRALPKQNLLKNWSTLMAICFD